MSGDKRKITQKTSGDNKKIIIMSWGSSSQDEMAEDTKVIKHYGYFMNFVIMY